ncbi:MAG: urease accessory protein UreF [Beijerinckiaceae bacterium]|nr:urease accessory protein UreF [Beijerinckiaceae bacterium]
MIADILPLLAWLSPAFPVGAFAYSHGLEWAHEAGDVTDAATLEGWIRDLAEHGSLRTDAVLLALAHDAAAEADGPRLAEIAELAQALAPSPERRLESVQQGNSFIRIARDAWPCAALGLLAEAWGGDVAYPVALGVTAAGHGIARRELLPAFGLAFTSNLVSAAIRLGVVGQTDGQRVIAAMLPAIAQLSAGLVKATLDDLGACAYRSDIASLKHETQYTRIFRS